MTSCSIASIAKTAASCVTNTTGTSRSGERVRPRSAIAITQSLLASRERRQAATARRHPERERQREREEQGRNDAQLVTVVIRAPEGAAVRERLDERIAEGGGDERDRDQVRQATQA